MTDLAPERFAPADRVLKAALAQVQLLAHLSPVNFEAELHRLRGADPAGSPTPAFEYRRPAANLSEVRRSLDRAAPEWQGLGEVGVLYAARARELALEAAICEARDRTALPALARERFDPGPALLADADALAGEWLAAAAAGEVQPAVTDPIRSDDEGDPRSLVCRLRAELGERRLGVRVVVARALAPLAAVGDGVVQVAAGRSLSIDDVERTVLHEVDGHVVPMERARHAKIGLFAIGCARGSDHQEGWALSIEERAGFLRGKRCAELALRHKAARAAHAGEPFAAVVQGLCSLHPDREEVVRAACRAFRGGGLGRELAYLPALLHVQRCLLAQPELQPTLTAGRVSIEGARVLSRYPDWG